MVRFFFISSCVAFIVIDGLGCDSPPAPHFCSPAALFGVPERLANGAAALASVSKSGSCEPRDATVTSADPAVVVVDRMSSRVVELRGVGVGTATIIVEEYGERAEYTVEVANHDRFEVLLIENGVGGSATSLGPLEGKILLASVEQNFVVTYHDSRGLLVGSGLADFLMPSATGGECQAQVSFWFDAQCWRPIAATQFIRVTVNEDEQLVEVTAVAADEVVDLLLIRTEEEDAQPGQTIRVDALGVTSDGTGVHGVHASAAEGWISIPVAYEYDPNAEPQSFVVSAVGLERELVFRGGLTFVEPFWESP